ncbi:plasmid partitioning protein RepA [Microvirga massiliensis]|uniref:plasmid partitioning protein RepA n=1 Tax=Microvirga massiliensis TaxID=1033741 RepID=UPI00062B5EBE|nr:plasmid partitioning protein RepA [Microvirga massiliensis]
MSTQAALKPDPTATFLDILGNDADELASKLQDLQRRIFPPKAKKSIRRLTSAEAAKFIGVTEGYLRQIAADGKVPLSEGAANGRRTYSVEDINAIREMLDSGAKPTRRYSPRRQEGEKLQIISVINFKGGSAKTTTTAHLVQYLALKGYRVLAIDLDPQASLSTLFGLQPETDVGENETLYGAIRYDDQRVDVTDIIRSTYLPGLHVIPGHLELMEFETTTPMAKEGQTFFARMAGALGPVADEYDVVVVDCPPNLGYLTMTALCAASAVLITVHPQMLDVLSMAQFLRMTTDLLSTIHKVRPQSDYDWMGYLVTRYEPNDTPQNQMVGFLRSLFGPRLLTNAMLKSTAIADAGLTKQTLYDVEKQRFNKGTYDRALESVDLVNGEIEALLRRTWGRV